MADKPEDSCYQKGEPCAFLRMKVENEKILMLPYGSLLFAELTPNTTNDKHELLKLVFATHDVKVTGYNLQEVLEKIQANMCHAIFKSNSSKAAFSDKKPAILNIEEKAIAKR